MNGDPGEKPILAVSGDCHLRCSRCSRVTDKLYGEWGSGKCRTCHAGLTLVPADPSPGKKPAEPRQS